MIILICSCGGRQEGETRAITGNLESADALPRQVRGLEDYPIPTSVEVIEMLQRAGAPYILGISNPVANADRYFTEKSKALNLGVYGAGLSYAATYEMNQETLRYLQVCRQLIEELNISTSFNMGFVERVERNLNDKDSLIDIVSESFYDTYLFLNDNHRDDLALLVLAGSWIEGIYLTSQIAMGARDNREITDIIAQQDESLGQLIILMDDHEDDEFIYSFYKELTEIYEFIKDLESPMTDDEVVSFSEMMGGLRTRVIS